MQKNRQNPVNVLRSHLLSRSGMMAVSLEVFRHWQLVTSPQPNSSRGPGHRSWWQVLWWPVLDIEWGWLVPLSISKTSRSLMLQMNVFGLLFLHTASSTAGEEAKLANLSIISLHMWSSDKNVHDDVSTVGKEKNRRTDSHRCWLHVLASPALSMMILENHIML